MAASHSSDAVGALCAHQMRVKPHSVDMHGVRDHSRMNVLFVIHYPVFGGPHNQARLLAPELEARGVSMTVLLPAEAERPGGASARLREGGVEVVTVPLGRVRATLDPRRQLRFLSGFPQDVKAIRGVIRSRKIHLVQIGGLVNPHGAIAARAEGVPVIWQLLDTRAPMMVRRLLMPLVLRLSDVVMTTGHAVADEHPGAKGLGDRLRVFFPPADPGYFLRDGVDVSAARGAFGFSPEDRVIGTVGNLNPQKGHEYLLLAAAHARTRLDDVRVLIVGSSHDTHRAYERKLHGLCRKLGLTLDRDVVFAGSLDDVRPALAAMDVFVLSSVPRSEGAPTVIEEAMLMQLPVVATDVGSVRELVDHENTGVVVPSGDPRALANAIVRLLEQPQTRTEFGLRGRDRAVATFSDEECARVHLSAYEYAQVHANRERPRVHT